jgi:hypothetical protein
MAADSTQLDAVETTASQAHPDSYRTFRFSDCLDELKATEELYSRIDGVDGKSRLEALSKCRMFAFFARDVETSRVHVISNSCRLRWCPVCSKARTNYIIHSLSPFMENRKVTRFLTLTVKHNNMSLSNQVTRLYDRFRTLRKSSWFKKHVSGGIWFFQIKLSANRKSWHPHLHCIITGKYLPKMELSRLWLNITGDSKIVDVKMIRNARETATYVARYSARPAQLRNYDIELRIEIFTAMHNRRLCGSWGVAKGVSLSPPKSVTSDKYVRLGSWSSVLSLRHSDIDAKTIYDCWYEKDVIDPSVSIRHIEDFIDGKIDFENYEPDWYSSPLLPGFQ